ncbi:hypothetical protein FFF34_006810 [Inquilinus sp. KBS0705]|nr:hypothetical protein FFF34_006810 [Inquilinus sp. KBS0705]
MENKPEGFDRANGQGQNHDTEGNIANVNNDTLKQDVNDKDLAEKVPTVVPESETPEEDTSTGENSSNKGQGPAGENL